MLLVGLMVFFHQRLRCRPTAQVLHGAVALLVLADPLNTLYLNTLYTEAAALIGLYAAAGALALLMLRVEGQRMRTTFSVLLAGLLVLLFSRSQHLLLPWLVMAALACARGSLPRPYWPGLLAVLAVGTVLQVANVQRLDPGIARANQYNTLFASVVPAFDDPAAAMPALGLPASCAVLAHTSWYYRRGFDIDTVCPQAFAVPRTRMAVALLREPAALFRFVNGGVLRSSHWRAGFLGEIEGGEFTVLSFADGIAYASIADAIRSLDHAGYLFLWLLPVFAQAALSAAPAGPDGRGRRPAAGLAWTAIAAIAIVWGTSLIGDGYSDLSRHAHLAFVLVAFAWTLVLAQMLSRLGALRPRAPAGGDGRAGGFAVAVAVIVAAGISLVVARQPVALAALHAGGQPERAGKSRMFEGCVKTPSGVAAVRARIGSTVTDARLAKDHFGVERLFPVPRDAPARVFRVTVDVPEGAGADRIDFEVVDGAGRSIRFDAVHVEPASATAGE